MADQTVTELPLVPYCRVSTVMQSGDGHSLDAQLTKIVNWARYAEVPLTEPVIEQASGKNVERDGLTEVLRQCADGEARGLVVTKLDRLSRSVKDFASILETFLENEWTLQILDLGVDLNTPIGRLVANILSSVAEFEREMIVERTKVGMAAAREKGVHVGRPKGSKDKVKRAKRAKAA